MANVINPIKYPDFEPLVGDIQDTDIIIIWKDSLGKNRLITYDQLRNQVSSQISNAGKNNLADMDDVIFIDVVNDQVVAYDSNTGKFVNKAISQGMIPGLTGALNNKVNKWENWAQDLTVIGKVTADNFVFSDTEGGGGDGPDGGAQAIWGFITGTLSDQTDLWSTLQGKAPLTHTHAISQVTGLQAALDGKASTTHGHTVGDVTGLQDALDGKDNYQSWNLRTNGFQRIGVVSGGVLDLVGGANTTVSYSAGGVVTIASTDTVYTHPGKAWVDKTALVGAVVISNLTIDALGHPTNWVTRSLTAANVGAEPSFTKNTAFNKNFGTTVGTVAQGDDSRIINGQTAFSWGNHVVAGYAMQSSLGSYVLKSGDTMTGTLNVDLGTAGSVLMTGPEGVGGIVFNSPLGNRADIRRYNDRLELISSSSSAIPTVGNGLSILNNGFVGIGTNNPSEILEISAAGNPAIRINTTIETGSPRVQFSQANNIRAFIWYHNDGYVGIGGGSQATGLFVRTNGNVQAGGVVTASNFVFG